MFLPEVMIAMLQQTEYGWTFLHWAWKRPSVHCLMLTHGLNQVEDSFAVWTGVFLNTGRRLVGLQMLQQGLLGMVALPTGRTVVGIVLAATGTLVHLHGCPAHQMLSTLGAHMYRLSLMHVQVPPESFGQGKILSTKCAVDLILTWLWDSKRHIPSTGRTCRKRCGQFTFEGQFGPTLDATQHHFPNDYLIRPQPHKTGWRLT